MSNDPFAKWRPQNSKEVAEVENDLFSKWRPQNSNLKKSTQEPEGSYLRMAAQVPRNIVSGAFGLGDIASMAANYGLRKLGSDYQFGYPSETVAKGIDTLTGGYTTPQTTGEKLSESATKAIGDTLAQSATGTGLASSAIKGAGALAKVGRGLSKINPTNPAALTATGAGAAAARSYHENNPDDFVGTLGTGLAADIATRGALGIANPRTMANVLKIKPENVEPFHNIGVSPTLGQASNHPLIKGTENIITNLSPTSELRKAKAHQYETMKDILGPGANDLALTEKEAGKVIKKSLNSYKDKASELTEKLKERYMKKVRKAPTHMVDVSDSLNYFDKIEHELGTAEMKAELKKTAIGKRYNSLKKMALENNGQVPIRDLEEFRTSLYDEISKGELGKVSRGRLTGLSHKLNDDIKDYMEGIGATKEWDQYNKFYSRWAEKRKPNVIEANETPIHQAEEIFDSIGPKGKINASLLDSVYASQKKSTQKEILDSLIQKMGKRGNEYDVHLLAKRISQQPKETRDLLLKPLDSAMKNKFKGVIESIDKIKDLANYGNPSRTAYTNTIIEGAKIGTLAGANALIGNNPEDAFWQYVLLASSASAMSKGLFANPRFINWAYRGSKIKSPAAMKNHIAGIKGILGRPFYQELMHSLPLSKD